MSDTFIHLVADYGIGDPAFGEVIQKLKYLDPTVTVYPTSVPAFSTLATGYWISQYALVNPLPGMMIYSNTAPRRDNRKARHKNEGEYFVYGLLKNGVRIAGVNAGYCFSFIKPYIQKLNFVNVANAGSQFRSRDFYPEGVIGIIHGDTKFIGKPLSIDKVPEVPQNRIAFVDGYGNLKTTIRKSSVNFTPVQELLVNLNGMIRTAFYTDGTFSVHEGELAFAPGSNGGDDRFMEIFLRGLSAWHEFGKPKVESEFKIISSI